MRERSELTDKQKARLLSRLDVAEKAYDEVSTLRYKAEVAEDKAKKRFDALWRRCREADIPMD